MGLEAKFNAVKANLSRCRQSLSHSDATNIDVELYHAVNELTEICTLLSSGLSDLAAKTSQLAAACDKAATGG